MDSKKAKENARDKKLILVLIALQLCLVAGYLYYHKYYWSQDVLRIVYLDSERVNSRLGPYGPGFERELVGMFCAKNGFRPLWIRVDSFSEGIAKLQSGRANLFIADPLEPDESWSNVQKGPGYMKSSFILAHNQWRYPMRSLKDLCTTEVLAPARFVYARKIASLEDDLSCSIDVKSTIDHREIFYKHLSSRDYRFGIIERLKFAHWHGFFLHVHQSYDFETEYDYAWLWSRQFKDLNAKFQIFWDEMGGSPELVFLIDKYFGFFPEEKDSYQINHFLRTVDRHLPEYMDTIIEAAAQYNIDPLLLTALIYQESHFNPEAQSRTGVRGLLQLTMDTADFLGVQNRLDPHQSIMGGAMYLDFLMERVNGTGASSWDRWFFVLAAYNQGLGHLIDAMELAERKELDSLRWSSLKEVYPLLSYRRYFETLPRGYARGFEAVNFVENIRYYYYLLYGLISLSRPEAENLGRLLDFVPGDWPD